MLRQIEFWYMEDKLLIDTFQEMTSSVKSFWLSNAETWVIDKMKVELDYRGYEIVPGTCVMQVIKVV
jgi:hypothetical protein